MSVLLALAWLAWGLPGGPGPLGLLVIHPIMFRHDADMLQNTWPVEIWYCMHDPEVSWL